MIILIEPNEKKKQKLCDIISKERIVSVKYPGEALNFIYKYQKKVDLIIANSNMPFVSDLISKKLLEKLCKKLDLEHIPLIGYYKEEDDNLKKVKEAGIALIKYDEKDPEFPFQYISLIRKEYPSLSIDMANIMAIRDYWLGIKKKKEKKKLKSEEIEDMVNRLTPVEEKEKENITREEYDKLKEEYDNKVKECDKYKRDVGN